MKTDFNEIDDGTGYIGYREALDIIRANVRPVGDEVLSLDFCVCRVAAADLVAQVSYPSVDVSLKDGFAVKSTDVVYADRRKPVCLKVVGSAFAGVEYEGQVKDGGAVKICSGSTIPDGADAVVSGEFCEEVLPGKVFIQADAGPGRNILRAGVEVEAGATIVRRGERLSPGYLGLAAAAGINQVRVYRRPRVAIISVGDEVVAPGEKLHIGQLYASNLVTMTAWLASFGISFVTSVVADNEDSIRQELQKHLPHVDAILTSGGAWGSERDLVIGALNKMEWQKLFHYVRMGPGKGIAFGLWENVPVFCLPGGPVSNEMAFLQLALPALLRMGGETRHPLQIVPARLTEDVKGRHQAWTEFKDAVVTLDGAGNYTVELYKNRSRLQAIARASGLICIPEGKDFLCRGDVIPIQLLAPRLDDL
ncbi:MAG: molybdopterin molybdotransferase MoeA [Syntrophaceae bacterium]|nr:molybdopterin molybdotransferase MoeA [Syntrophaceae bacterium]